MNWNNQKILEIVGVLAVVFSLLLVAFEIRQANRIAVVNTEFELRNSYQQTNHLILSNPDMVDFLLRIQTAGEPLEGPNRVRAMSWTYLNLNSWVAMELAYENGMTTEETYQNILDNIDNVMNRASPEMREVWRLSIDSFPSLSNKAIFQRAKEVLARYEADKTVE